MNRRLIRHGFVLILVALLSGLFVPVMQIPRLGLSAHTIGILGGVLLIAVGAVWQHFALSDRQRRVMSWSWLYSSYVNWLGCLVGAIFGAGRTTPVAADGAEGPAGAEAVVAVLLISVGVASFVAVGLSLWGLRLRRESQA
ncbi:MAG: hydrogenase [Myxococcota bacterium]